MVLCRGGCGAHIGLLSERCPKVAPAAKYTQVNKKGSGGNNERRNVERKVRSGSPESFLNMMSVIPEAKDRLRQVMFIAQGAEAGGDQQETATNRDLHPQPPCR